MGPASATGVYDHAPQNVELPYIVVGEDFATPDDTDDTLVVIGGSGDPLFLRRMGARQIPLVSPSA